MEVDTVIAFLCCLASVLLCWVLLSYYATILPVQKNLLTKLDSLFILTTTTTIATTTIT